VALGTVPALLFLLALLPRVWAPDLAPFGPVQAALIGNAARQSGSAWVRVYADPTFPLAALVDPLLRDLPSPVAAWVVVRALLDSLGVALLYLAIGRVLNRGVALIAALCYAFNPALWAMARDPAGSLAGLVVAAGLLAGACTVRRPTPVNGFMLGLALALLVRLFPPGWGFILAGALCLALARASWITGSVTALAMLLGAGTAVWARPAAPTSDLASGAGPWLFMLGSPAWLPAGSALVGSVVLARLIAPVAIIGLVLVLSGVGHGLLHGWKVSPSPLLLPCWAAGTLLAVALFPAEYPSEAVVASAMLPALASLVVVPLAMARWAAVRWATGLAILLMTAIGGLTIALNLIAVERASHEQAGFGSTAQTAESPASGLGAAGSFLGLRAASTENRSLRTWQALVDSIKDAAERTGATEVVALADDGRTGPMLEGLLRGSPGVRRLPQGISVLPLSRETLFLILPDTPVPVELTRPSSILIVAMPTGETTGAQLATLRARPAIDWLARAEPVQGVRFADGSAIVGVVADRGRPGRLSLILVWEVPAAAEGRSIGQTAQVTIRGNGPLVRQEARLLPTEARRGGELVVQQVPDLVAVPIGPELAVTVSLLDVSGATIPTSGGAAESTVLTRQRAAP
jgi:hypothetical protein